jgi:hypothetical protein
VGIQREIILPTIGDTVEIVALYKENKDLTFKAVALGDHIYYMRNFLRDEMKEDELLKHRSVKAKFKITKDVIRFMNPTRMVLIEKRNKW